MFLEKFEFMAQSTMSTIICPVVLCGGTGTRLWPLSRKSLPKQFVPAFSGKSLLQLTLERFSAKNTENVFCDKNFKLAPRVLCVGSVDHEHMLYEIAEKSEVQLDLLLEPCQKNTCAAIVASSIFLKKKYEKINSQDSVVAVFCPADHFLSDAQNLLRTILKAAHFTDEESIFVVGISPIFPSTSYGYLSSEGNLERDKFLQVRRFIEKPDYKKASQLFKKQGMYWNSGNFIAKPSVLLAACSKFVPKVLESVEHAFVGFSSSEEVRLKLNEKNFKECPNISFDYAVMERYHSVRMLPLNSQWSDVGSWNAFAELFPEDVDGNRKVGKAHFFRSKNNFAYTTGRPIVTLGLKDTVVVETPDVVYVAKKSYTEELKEAVKKLEKDNVNQALNHRQVNRPWGVFDSIEKGERFQVKKITVKCGGRLSLQRHKKRAEHWVVVKGKALVTRGDEIFELNENESTYIPIGVKHRLENPFKSPLEVIEVQSGSYLGEDDIERLEDIYGRQTDGDT